MCALMGIHTGWTGSIFYSVAIGLMLKLTASAMQQKLVGERLSHIVKVRQFVGINSTFIKAMRLVLEKDGLGLAKVCILIGGPDWPVSITMLLLFGAIFPPEPFLLCRPPSFVAS